MPPNVPLDSEMDEDSPAPDLEIDDLPASIPQTQAKSDDEADEADEVEAEAKQQMKQELAKSAADRSKKRKRGAQKKETKKEPSPVASVNGKTQGEDDSDDSGNEQKDEFFDVEKITAHKFQGKKCLYRVRWVGWSEADDTWEPEANLLPESSAVLAAYHTSIGGTPQPTKKIAKSASKANLKDESLVDGVSSPTAKRSKRTNAQTLEPKTKEWEAEELGTWLPSDKTASWEDLIHSVETVERDDTGNLFAYIRFRNGKRSKVANNIYIQRCPRKMLEFYEDHLSV